MLKITVSRDAQGNTFILSGRLAGPWVQELRRCWQNPEPEQSARCHVDLREVTYIDTAGKTLLSQMHCQGATIEGSGCMTLAIVKSLSKARGSGATRH